MGLGSGSPSSVRMIRSRRFPPPRSSLVPGTRGLLLLPEGGLVFVRRDDESSVLRPRPSLLPTLVSSRPRRPLSLSFFREPLSLLRLLLSLFELLLPPPVLG